MIEGILHQEYVMILDICIASNRASKTIKS
jgi:hypothetical protein